MDIPAAPLMLPGMSHNVVCKDITETSTYCAPSAKRHCSDAAHISCPCTYSSICPIINLSIIHPPFHPSTHPSIQLSIHLFTHGCLCTGSSLLGRAKQLGPHSFVHLSFFPANDQLEVALPPLQTPFQAQTFCPEFHFWRQLPLQIDARMVRELATQVEQLAACCRHLLLLWACASVTSPHSTTSVCWRPALKCCVCCDLASLMPDATPGAGLHTRSQAR